MTNASDPEGEDQKCDFRREIEIQDEVVAMVSSVESYSVVMGASVALQHEPHRRGGSAHDAPLATMLDLLSSSANTIAEHEGNTMTSSVATTKAFVSLFQRVEDLEKELEGERAISLTLRDENDELVNDNRGLVEDQKELEGKLKEASSKSGSFQQQNEEMQIELERLQEIKSTAVEDKTTQMQQNVQTALYNKFMMEQHMQSLRKELNQTHTAAETILNQRNEFENKNKTLQKQMKKCSCQDPLVFLPNCHLGGRARGRLSLPAFLAGAPDAEQPCAAGTPARAADSGGLSRSQSMIPSMTINRTSHAQQHNHISARRRNTMSLDAFKNQQHQPTEIASLAAAAEVMLRTSHHDGPPSGEEDNIEPCQRKTSLIKRLSLGGGSSAEDVDMTDCTLSQLEADASGGGNRNARTKAGWRKQLQNFMNSSQIDKFDSGDQAQSQCHHQQVVDNMIPASLSRIPEYSILEAGGSQVETDEDKQFGEIGVEQEGDHKKCMRAKENVMRRHSSFAPRTQEHHHISARRRNTMSFEASKNQQHHPTEIASLAAAAELMLTSHHDGPPSGEEDNIEPCQRKTSLSKRWSLGGGSSAEDVDMTDCILSQLEADASGGGNRNARTTSGWRKQLQNFMNSSQINKFDGDDQAQSQYHLTTSLSLIPDYSTLEAGGSQGETDADKQFVDIGIEQEGDQKKCMRPIEIILRRHSSFAPRTPASSLHMVNSIVSDLVEELGTPFGQDAADQEEALREVVVASSAAVLAVDDFPFQATTAASVDESREKKETGYTRWSNEHTSGALDDESMSVNDGSTNDSDTWFTEEEEPN
jgi:hypothetical protein